MSSTIILRYVNPWKFRREQEAQRLTALRSRDGDECRRCRRPIRFDLPEGHDTGPKIDQLAGGTETLDNLCLTHRRCNVEAADVTREVQERVRRRNEAELFSKSRKRKRA
jgi:hypothetical protein